jgi:hypothetical protein
MGALKINLEKRILSVPERHDAVAVRSYLCSTASARTRGACADQSRSAVEVFVEALGLDDR